MTISIDGARVAQSVRPQVVDVRFSSGLSAPGSDSKASSTQSGPVDPVRVAQSTRQVEEMFQSVRRSLQFRDDPNSGRMVVSVIDADSGEVIREIPPEQMLRMAASLEVLNGMLLGERV
jgi:flagellar protein FlaG